ncbi:PLP-dependent aminotransferase family protein [Achromobacter insolitus]|uniref:HTH-type transcriptional regulatory protein GabR n=2 Tax=Achromobacter insolitus TaxID=217204 RepID=A0A6S7FDZ0_9BURK|nr:HTH-type transcriptional regulatory protein GabR [Achromobacter insolitus]CAB3937440.1 HTH-type transcriptional regulatory protein GabR [Achromobacter insolitus]
MRSIVGDLLQLRLADGSSEPMNKRLYRGIREAILDGAIAADSRLPATRDLAAELGIARNTVVHVYSQLLAEGYTRSRQGNGTFVNASVPDSYLASGRRKHLPPPAQARAALSPRGAAIVDGVSASPYQWGAFMPGVPDLTEFPHKKFGRIFSSLWRNPSPDLLTYAYGGGLPALREALAQHLALTRSIDCDPEQIIITEGSHQAIDLTTRILGEAGETAWVEDPGYWGARTILQANGLRTVHLPVDEEGMRLPDTVGTPPRFIFVTPSHQYPLGPVMSLTRRRQLLAVARQSGSWIIEDDYDSEFRFSGRPIASLLGLEPDAPVIYMGTFSKTLYPGLRVGYLVLPKTLTAAFQAAHAELYREGHLMTHAALATFISEGHYAAHIRRMRMLYGRRRAMLVNLIERRLGPDWLHRDASMAGLHLVLTLPPDMDDLRVVDVARGKGVLTRALSRYYVNDEGRRPGLLLGYACVPEHDIARKFEVLLESLAEVARAPAAAQPLAASGGR